MICNETEFLNQIITLEGNTMATPQEERTPAYSVEQKDNQHGVVDRSGRTILQCAGVQNAMHYATLMNQAFEAGYKTGYRDAQSSAP